MNQNINDIFYISKYNIEAFDKYYKAKTQYMVFNIIKTIQIDKFYSKFIFCYYIPKNNPDLRKKTNNKRYL